jgi:Na+/melibiose symporter-like transporter
MKMGKIEKQIKSEIKQLPFMLGKLLGGIMAVIGFPGIIIVNRKSNATFSDILPYFLLGIIGVCIFLISSKLFAERGNESAQSTPTLKEKRQTSIISWVIFLIFIAIFILITFIITM